LILRRAGTRFCVGQRLVGATQYRRAFDLVKATVNARKARFSFCRIALTPFPGDFVGCALRRTRLVPRYLRFRGLLHCSPAGQP